MDWTQKLVLFMGYLIEQGKKSTTVRSYLSAIKAVLSNDNISICENNFQLNALVKACKLKNDQVYARFPISRKILEMMLKKLPKILKDQPSYQIILFKALFLTTYSGLFRIGEVTESQHVIKAKDVQIGTNKRKLMFILRSSKTHTPADRPQIVKISAESVTGSEEGAPSIQQLCPFQALRDYLDIRQGFQRKSEQFFVYEDGSPVTPPQFRELMKKTLIAAGFEDSLYSVHSMRGGKAFDLLKAGVPIETIMRLGRWKSNAVYAYLRQY